MTITVTALATIEDAYGRCNRLSPGEVLSADDALYGFTRLNTLVDQMSAEAAFLYRDILTSNAQTGHITLGTGAWAAISPGDPIVSATASNIPIAQYSMQRYNMIYDTTMVGLPRIYAPDGLSTVFLWPVPNGQTIKLQSRVGVAAFADLTTAYTVPNGYKNLLAASLAVRVCKKITGKMDADVVKEEIVAIGSVRGYEPAFADSYSYTGNRGNGSGYPTILYDGS